MHPKLQRLAASINAAHHANEQGDFKQAEQLCKEALKINKTTPEAWYNLGIALRGLNHKKEAIRAQREALKLARDSADAQNSIGLELLELGEHKDAETALRRALRIDPNHGFAYSNLGKLFTEQKKYIEAMKMTEIAYKLLPDHPEVLVNFGASLNSLGKYEKAEPILRRSIAINKKSIAALNNLGRALSGLKRHEEAEAVFRLSTKINPQSAEAFSNLGATLNKLKNYKQAEVALRHAIQLNPQSAEAFSNLGATLNELKDYDEAEAAIQNAIQIDPESFDAHLNLSTVLINQNKHQKAEKSSKKALRLNPSSIMARINLAYALKAESKEKEAEHVIQSALEINPEHPEANNNLSHLLFAQDRFEEGWSHYEYRFSTKESTLITPLKNAPRWDGLPHDQLRLLVIAEQGIGDEILYAQFLQQLNEAATAKPITVTADTRLIPIYERSFPKLRFLDRKQPIEEDQYNAQIPLASLGQFFLKDKSDFAKIKHPLLRAKQTQSNRLREEILNYHQSKFICGVSWKTRSDKHGEDRSMRLEDLKPILALKDIQFINLQYGQVNKEIEDLKKTSGIEILQIAEIDNFADIDGLLSLINACDFVVTASNVTTHLAGSIGIKTYQIDPKGNGKFWYWKNLTEEGCSLWYPSVKVYEQEKIGDWRTPIMHIFQEIKTAHLNHET